MDTRGKRILNACRDFLEVTVPSLTFICMFVVFIIAVVMRYVFREPQGWTYEFSQIAFLWTGVFAACTAQKWEDHIVFSMVYDGLKPKGRNICRLVGHLMILILAICVIPSIRYLTTLTVPTSILGIPRFIVFAPYVIMLVVTVARYAWRAIEDVKTLRDGTYEQRYNTEAKESLI